MINYKKLIFQNKLFFFGLILKFHLGILITSSVLTELFIPFVDYFISNHFANPYEYFLAEDKVSPFPYPAMMLYILSFPKLIFGWIAPNHEVFNLFLYRLPLIIADICIFFVIKSWLKKKYHNKLIWFYWLSPVLIYINFIHGQLDVIPIAFLFISLYFLFKERILLSVLFIGIALSVKTNILLVFPFYFLYLFSKGIRIPKLFTLLFISFAVFIIINHSYLLNTSFLQMVFQNQEQAKLFNSFILLNEMNIFLIPATFLILFIRGILIKTYNRDIFIIFLGLTFSIILLFIPPQHGWYYWLIPFLAYFYIKEDSRSPIIFFGLQLSYLLYFLIIGENNYFSFLFNSSIDINNYPIIKIFAVDKDKFIFLVFTFLQTILLINCFWIYKKGLESYRYYKITAVPFLIGIGGDSGAGKTTISNAIYSLFTAMNTTVLCGDDMHKWQRGHKKWNELTHLNPKANHLHKEMSLLKKIKMGRPIYRRHYDHGTGEFTLEKKLYPNNLIIYEGLHPFYLSSQRDLYDLKIFIKPSLNIIYHWKIIRDKKNRGYSKEIVIKSIEKRKKDSKKYIETQVKQADVVIETLPTKKISDIGNDKELVIPYYVLTLSNDVYMEYLLKMLKNTKTLFVQHQYIANDRQKLILKGNISTKQLDKISTEFLDGLKDLGVNTYNLPNGLFGVLILILTYYAFEKADYVK